MTAPDALPAFDLAFTRSQFPAFSEDSLSGWAFFENAGGSYMCRQVVERLHGFHKRTKVQPYAPYPASRTAGRLMDEGHERIAEWCCAAPEAALFGPSTTQNVATLAAALRETLKPGDAIVVTNQDHEANSGAWRRLEKAGAEIREWKMQGDGRLDPADLAALLDDKVRLAAFPHCSNILGQINDVKAICAMIRDAGALSCVDGVSAAPHGLPDFEDLGADIYLFSAYKTFGPHQGVMLIREEVNRSLPNQSHWFNDGALRKRLVPAGPDHAQVAGMEGVATYLEALESRHFPVGAPFDRRAARLRRLIAAREAELLAPLLDWAKDREGLRLLGPATTENRAPTVAMVLDVPGEEAAAKLARWKVMAGGGDFYAVRLLSAMGVDPAHGVLRLSFTHYTSEAEVAQAVDGLSAILGAD
ncbi:aminotransferase class V-fold PLP-dependent enzyme [Rhodovulum sp. DZ06]|uniref:aminotransferase class V-fold PLP-dependent enzyme n=1 Tax=Rhodovulum sp. DZ06 TaxID=3425126 RepID=UPI003D32D712